MFEINIYKLLENASPAWTWTSPESVYINYWGFLQNLPRFSWWISSTLSGQAGSGHDAFQVAGSSCFPWTSKDRWIFVTQIARKKLAYETDIYHLYLMTLGNMYGFWWFWVWIKPWCLSRSGAYPCDSTKAVPERPSCHPVGEGELKRHIQWDLVWKNIQCQYGWAFLNPHGQMVCFDGEVHYFDILWRLNFPLFAEVCSNSPCFVNVGPAPSGRFWRMAWIDTHHKEKERERATHIFVW